MSGNWDRPAAVITVRASDSDQPESTALLPGPLAYNTLSNEWDPASLPGEYIILVHGVADRFTDARYYYALMRKNLSAFPQLPQRVVEFHWPSNASTFLTFIEDPNLPQKVAPRLAQYILSACTGARFRLISHSWGGEVVLRVIDYLRTTHPAELGRITGVCMMACAVPVADIQPAGLGPRPGDDFPWRVLYSPSDTVISVVMSTGLTLTGHGLFPEGVGEYGNPMSVWPDSNGWLPYFRQRPSSALRQYRHSCYWPSNRAMDPPPPWDKPEREYFLDLNETGPWPDLFIPRDAAAYVANFLGAPLAPVTPTYTSPAYTPNHFSGKP